MRHNLESHPVRIVDDYGFDLAWSLYILRWDYLKQAFVLCRSHRDEILSLFEKHVGFRLTQGDFDELKRTEPSDWDAMPQPSPAPAASAEPACESPEARPSERPSAD